MSGSGSVAALCEALGVPEPIAWRAYFDVVQSWGKRTDLTAARSDAELAEILFLDAGELIHAGWTLPSSSLLDVGAGVGAPTIPLSLADTTLRATLIEPRRKRTTFLRSAVGSLDIAERVAVLEQRVDPKDPIVEGTPFDIALSRATFPPEQWLKIGLRLAKEVWVFTAGTEPDASSDVRLHRRLAYRVPSTGAPRAILAYRR